MALTCPLPQSLRVLAPICAVAGIVNRAASDGLWHGERVLTWALSTRPEMACATDKGNPLRP